MNGSETPITEAQVVANNTSAVNPLEHRLVRPSHAELLQRGGRLTKRDARRMKLHRERSEDARGALVVPAFKRIRFQRDGERFLGGHSIRLQEPFALWLDCPPTAISPGIHQRDGESGQGYILLTTGVLIVVVMIFFPDGINGLFEDNS